MLERAALELMREEGVLAGLNLRRVADRVGVNRGLVYHYYGSRRALLRSALRAAGLDLRNRLLDRRSRGDQGFRGRVAADFEALSGSAGDYFSLVALLVVDGDPKVRVLPVAEESARLLAEDRKRGELPPDADVVALDVVITSLTAAYSLFRERFAAETGVLVEELDQRVAAAVDRILAGYTSGL